MRFEKVMELKETYIPGMRIEHFEMEGEPQMPNGLQGTVRFVDDIGQVHMRWDNGSTLALHVNEDSFKILDEDRIKVLLIEPKQVPRVIQIGTELRDLQDVVGGPIEVGVDLGDVCLVCNEEGKLNGMEPNITLAREEDDEITDIIYGTAFFCGARDGKFTSLNPYQIKLLKDAFSFKA